MNIERDKDFEQLEDIAAMMTENPGIEFENGKYVYYGLDGRTAFAAVYISGAWSAWQAAKAVPEWISVDDRLPPVDETVLVCWGYAADIEPDKEYLTIDEDCNEYWPNCQDEPPTHWMPLPGVIVEQEPK